MKACCRCMAALLLLGSLWPLSSSAGERLVFGSFHKEANARAFARLLSGEFNTDISVATVRSEDISGALLIRHRVVTALAADGALAALRERAELAGRKTWYWRTDEDVPLAEQPQDAPEHPAAAENASPVPVIAPRLQRQPTLEPKSDQPAAQPQGRAGAARHVAHTRTEFDLGLQSRAYAHSGQARQSRWQLSASGQLDWFRESANQRHSVTVSPFFRIDGEDDERTHVDLREGYYSYIGDRFEVHAGARQIFWGVTEFKHLVDVLNQTDLVENIDGEDKLGQPLLQLSLSRNWGVLDLFVLGGHRQRTFPGDNGRLRFALPVNTDDAEYASSDEERRIDGAIRWSHYAGPLSWGLYHFSGTNRDPLLLPRLRPDGDAELLPYYTVIDQSGLEAQLIAGDWAFKLETISRSGDGDRYTAANLGFERTLVGVLGSRTDLGLVVEYLFDDRGDGAHSTVFERDLAVGTRWAFNDAASTEALLGVIWDTETDEYVVSLEASRQFGQYWQFALEGRAFAGAPRLSATQQLQAFADGSAKTSFLQRDDFLQLELTRYF